MNKICTPFGDPVEPEVKITYAVLSELESGRASAAALFSKGKLGCGHPVRINAQDFHITFP